MVTSTVKWYLSLPNFVKVTLTSLFVIVPAYLSAFLSIYISKVVNEGLSGFFIHIVVLFLVSTFIVSFYRIFQYGKEEINKMKTKKKEIITFAYDQIQRFVTENQDYYYHVPTSFIDENLVAEKSLNNIKVIVEKIYNLFESKYNLSDQVDERISFEVTFMTLSYIDNKITVPVYANREKRAPKSMLTRNTKSDVYDNTVTAMIYREPNPVIHIIEDTSNPKENYDELYVHQKDRIKSSIVFPVLSPQNILLGTLVVHCDQSSFFEMKEKKYWNELLEIFSKYIGLQKIKLDYLAKQKDINLF